MKYGEEMITQFDIDKNLEIWPNKNKKNYTIKISLPEFSCLCPRSGYPDFATVNLEYVPDKFVVELKALKLFINSYRDKSISHEDSANEIFDILYEKLNPRHMRVIMDFNPRGNVHTMIEIDSETMKKEL